MAKKTKKVHKSKVRKVVKSVKSNKVPVLPLGNRALIRPFTKDELEKKNSFGIILPGADTKEKAEQGVVLAVGEGAYQNGICITPTVHIGDVVAFSKYGYDDITVDGEELYLIKEENILAIINK